MKANQGKFRLRDLLSVPMQRVLKYHLLLKVCLSLIVVFVFISLVFTVLSLMKILVVIVHQLLFV